MDTLERRVEVIERKLQEAFPAGDHRGHCRYHELMIETIEERRALRRAVMQKTIAGLVWAVAIAVGLALWQWIKTGVKG